MTMPKEKRLTFDNVRETLFELYSNGKDVDARHNYWYDARHTNKTHEGFEQMIFTNHDGDNLRRDEDEAVWISCLTLDRKMIDSPDRCKECIDFELFSHRGDYRINIWVKLTGNGMILRIPLMSRRKQDVMTAGIRFTPDSANQLYDYIKDIRHPKVREFVNHLFFRVISPSVTINSEKKL